MAMERRLSELHAELMAAKCALLDEKEAPMRERRAFKLQLHHLHDRAKAVQAACLEAYQEIAFLHHAIHINIDEAARRPYSSANLESLRQWLEIWSTRLEEVVRGGGPQNDVMQTIGHQMIRVLLQKSRPPECDSRTLDERWRRIVELQDD
ncbi:hypothetical protein BDW02DRAFT_600093 [Decorospora gaudefroyi]|uniref:Uncharacterized protein n=1 Tax=Decorospora gaudefroyi TaxID=184978 RepID=A0A6A5K7M5_9PLEO|nr:hypothetical protein BDW02DRAFT_600093 [Decorospora gaudefroyi]